MANDNPPTVAVSPARKTVILAFTIDEDGNMIVMPSKSNARVLAPHACWERLRSIIESEPAAQPSDSQGWAGIARDALKALTNTGSDGQ